MSHLPHSEPPYKIPMSPSERAEIQEKCERYQKIVLALLQQCQNEGLTVADSRFVLEAAIRRIDKAIANAPVIF